MFFLLIPLATDSSSAQPIELVSPNPESQGQFGYLAVIPDARGPGLGNVLVGAPGEGPAPSPSDAGRAYLFNGSTGTFIATLSSPNEEVFGIFGVPSSSVPDVNGDGFPELVVAAQLEDPGSSPENAGRAYIFDGSTYQVLKTHISPNEVTDGRFGRPVAGISDVNGNGTGDVIVGARNESPGGSPSSSGRAYILDGSSGVLIHTLTSPSETLNGLFGGTLAVVPDVKSDGMDDILVGAFGESSGEGRVHLFDGSTGNWLRTFDSPTPRLAGEFGGVVAGVPDTNGDGRGDVIVGAPGEYPDGGSIGAGRAHLFDGSNGDLLLTLESPDEAIAISAGDFGRVVMGSADLNGDGLGEILIGESDGGPDTTGQVYVFDGSNGDLLYTLVSPNEEPDGDAQFARVAGGDLNGDGETDLAVGAWGETVSGLNAAGRTYIYHAPFPSVDIAPGNIGFGTQTINQGPTASMAVILTNTGSESLPITEVKLVGTGASQFTIIADSGETSLGVGMSRAVDVAFDPDSEGIKEAKLRFVSHSFVWQTELTG
ncbi:MAG: FG-GAP repeat protein, partial [Candidatus Omnitrophica bacterium]|nr:FG-GAP repeat protein [Candidatus Omnitrophota bacterium]